MKPEINPQVIGKAFAALATIGVLIYYRLLLLAGAIAFAAIWAASRSARPDIPLTQDDGDACLDSFWRAFEQETPCPEEKKTVPPTSELDESDSHVSNEPQKNEIARRVVNGRWADEPDEDNLDFLPYPVLGEQGVGNIKKKPPAPAPTDASDKQFVHRVNPKQVYLGGLPFKTTEDELQQFFTKQCGAVDTVKLLKHPDGKSKGVAFVTFIDVDDAHSALRFHDQEYEGRLLTVRITNPDKGKEKNSNVKKKWPGLAPNNPNSSSIHSQLEKLLSCTIEDTAMQISDFDYQTRKILITLLRRNPDKCQECLQHIKLYTAPKERDSVRNWRGYIYTLLSKHEPELSEELKIKKHSLKVE